MFGADENGGPAEELPFEARKLGAELVAQMTDARDSFGAMGDTIVTDSAKLAYVGRPRRLPGHRDELSRGLVLHRRRSEQRAGRHPPQRRADRLRGAAAARVQHLRAQRRAGAGDPDPRWYNCGAYPWWYYSDTAIRLATTSEMWEWNPQTGQYLWKVLVLALPGGVERAFHGTPPSDQLLNRMFGPVVDIDKVEPARTTRAASRSRTPGSCAPPSGSSGRAGRCTSRSGTGARDLLTPSRDRPAPPGRTVDCARAAIRRGLRAMKRLMLLAALPFLAHAASAQASFVQELGSPTARRGRPVRRGRGRLQQGRPARSGRRQRHRQHDLDPAAPARRRLRPGGRLAPRRERHERARSRATSTRTAARTWRARTTRTLPVAADRCSCATRRRSFAAEGGAVRRHGGGSRSSPATSPATGRPTSPSGSRATDSVCVVQAQRRAGLHARRARRRPAATSAASPQRTSTATAGSTSRARAYTAAGTVSIMLRNAANNGFTVANPEINVGANPQRIDRHRLQPRRSPRPRRDELRDEHDPRADRTGQRDVRRRAARHGRRRAASASRRATSTATARPTSPSRTTPPGR